MNNVQEDTFMRVVTSTPSFWSNIKKFEQHACDVVQSNQDALPEGFLKIRQMLQFAGHNTEQMTEEILDYATDLLAIPTRYPPDGPRSKKEQKQIELLEQWMKETAQVVDTERRQTTCHGPFSVGAVPADVPVYTSPAPGAEKRPDPNELRDELLMESLTAAWFALYFLGLPFTQIWERVRRMADQRGGYPSGACVAKFIGDIHRIARLEMTRELKAKGPDFSNAIASGTYDDSQTLVLSYMPFGLLRRLIYQDAGHKTPAVCHRLGNCYMLLQMRLYIRGGFPIRYLVSSESLRQNWKHLLANPNPANASQTMFDDIIPWMETVFAKNAKHQSVQLLTSNESIAGMATCVLGRQVGVYVLDTVQTSLPFAGNQLADSLLQSYRTKLNNIERGTKGHVIQLWPPVSDKMLEKWMTDIKATLHNILMKKQPPGPNADAVVEPTLSVAQPPGTSDEPSVRETEIRDLHGRGHDIPAMSGPGADTARQAGDAAGPAPSTSVPSAAPTSSGG